MDFKDCKVEYDLDGFAVRVCGLDDTTDGYLTGLEFAAVLCINLKKEIETLKQQVESLTPTERPASLKEAEVKESISEDGACKVVQY